MESKARKRIIKSLISKWTNEVHSFNRIPEKKNFYNCVVNSLLLLLFEVDDEFV